MKVSLNHAQTLIISQARHKQPTLTALEGIPKAG